MNRVHNDIYKRYQQSLEQSKGSTQGSITAFVTSDRDAHYSSTHPRQRSLTNSLISNLIVKCCLPISLVDNESFRAFLTSMDPKFVPPCRQTVTYSLLPQMLQQQQAKVRGILDTCTDVSLTADIWTDRTMHAFLAVTAHAFSNGNASSLLLAFRSFQGSHTGQSIADALESIIDDSGIRNKIRSVVTDNASNMRKAMSVLLQNLESTSVIASDDADDYPFDDPSLWQDLDGETATAIVEAMGNQCEHMSCFAHSLQLVVRDGLSSLTACRPMLAKCSKLSNLVHQSANFRGTFEKIMGNGHIIPASNETRWNSTFRQLDAIAELDHAKLNSVLQATDHQNLILSTKEVGQLTELVGILQPFSEATDVTQGEKTVTISCVIPTVLSLDKILGMHQQSIFSGFVTVLRQSLHDRFSNIFSRLRVTNHKVSHPNSVLKFDSDMFLMSTALDPVYAYNWLQDHPGSTEDKEALRITTTGMYKY